MRSLDILIEELLVHAHIGCTPEERSFPQRLLFSLDISNSVTEKKISGDLDKTVCYAKASELIVNMTQKQEWILLEDLAEEVAGSIFQAFGTAQSVSLTIKKFAVPNTSWTGIRFFRNR